MKCEFHYSSHAHVRVNECICLHCKTARVTNTSPWIYGLLSDTVCV
jgi:hypothetical protein